MLSDSPAAGWRRVEHVQQLIFNPLAIGLRDPNALQSSEPYRDLDNTGTTYLANKLSNHLINEVTRKLPEIQSYVDKTCGGGQPRGGGVQGWQAGWRRRGRTAILAQYIPLQRASRLPDHLWCHRCSPSASQHRRLQVPADGPGQRRQRQPRQDAAPHLDAVPEGGEGIHAHRGGRRGRCVRPGPRGQGRGSRAVALVGAWRY